MTPTALGTVTVNGTSYRVTGLEVGNASRTLGIRGNYAFEGPRCSAFFVTDHGTHVTSVSVNGGARPLRGLTRAHLLTVAQ